MTDIRHRYFVFLLVTVLTATADQSVKAVMVQLLTDSDVIVVMPFLNFRLGYNTGISFSMFEETFRKAPWVLVAVQCSIVGLIAVVILRTSGCLQVMGVALIAGGAAGNIIDRIRLGMVVDYIDAYYAGWHWPTFNLADVWISIGVALLIVRALLAPKCQNP